MRTQSLALDRSALIMSIACLVHCLALPILAIASPFFALAAEAEWLHWTFAAIAIIASTGVIAFSAKSLTSAFVAQAIIGNLIIVAGIFGEAIGIGETVPTAIGGAILAYAHGVRLLQHKNR